MRPVAFRVQMYKSVIDSSWIDLGKLTVVVGKNESGKTTLLKALHKFKPWMPGGGQGAEVTAELLG
jgi:AAA15 family ATPase/GTPase